jgi:hypothetical protein
MGGMGSRYTVEQIERRLLLSAVNVLGYHNDAASTGQNLAETALTPANVNVASFGKIYSTTVDGQVYAQPLYVGSVNVTAGLQPGLHNVSYVATEADSLYAIDADTGTVLWTDSFLVPEPGLGGNLVVTTVPSSDVNTSNISPQIGITSTPAIDLATGFLYLTAKTKQVVNGDSSNPHYVYTLYKVNIQSGAFSGVPIADTSYQSSGNTYTYNSGPSVADPNGNGDGVVNVGGNNEIIFNALRQLNRTAITLNNGSVYIGFASHGDNPPYHGWILGYDESSLAPTAAFCANPDGDDCGIWMGGGKIAVDAQGFMYVQTGNGLFDTTLNAKGLPSNGDYGDSFLKLAVDPTTTANNPDVNGWGLKVVDYFTPSNQQTLNFQDQDLGSGAPLLLPATAGSVTIGSASHPNLLVGAGKAGTIYLIDTNSMGHYTSGGPDHVVQEFLGLPFSGAYDTPAFYFDGTTARIYYDSSGDKARSFTIANATLTLDTISSDSYGVHCGSTSISANQTSGGIAWNIDPASSQLRAYNASNMTQELWTSAQAAGTRDALGVAVKFTSSTIVNGEVLVGTNSALVAYARIDVINATSGNETISLKADADTLHIDWTMGSADEQVLINNATGLAINGNAGAADTITLDYSNGNPLPNTLHLNGMFTIDNLQGANPLAGTTLDIGRSTVFISYGPSDPIAAIRGYLQAGYNSGAWNGTPTASTGVITSAAAQANPNSNAAIGYADWADGQGVNTTTNTIELKYTLVGDANLDGQVNSADLQALLASFNTPGSWDQGDFNYDDNVNSADLQALLSTFNTSVATTTAEATRAPAGAATSTSSAIAPATQSSKPAAAPQVLLATAPKRPSETVTHRRKHR